MKNWQQMQSWRSAKSPRNRGQGFSLIELMITVAIVGIIAAIAYPSYKNQIVKSNRAAAQAFLMDVAQRQQQYLMDNRSYASTISSLNVTVPSDVSKFYIVSTTDGGTADEMTASAGPPPSFTVAVWPKSGTTQAGDGVLSITNTGVKSPADKW